MSDINNPTIITVTDGTHTVKPTREIKFIGATVTDNGNGEADISGFGNGTGTTVAVAGAAVLNQGAGFVTSEALVAAVTYTLTLANNKIKAGSVVLVNATNSAALPVTLTSVVVTANQVVVTVGMAALTGTVKIAFAVFN